LLIKLSFLRGFNSIYADLVVFLYQESCFIGFCENEHKVCGFREGFGGGELRKFKLLVDRNQLPMEITIEHDLIGVQLWHNEGETIVITILIMLKELSLKLLFKIIVFNVIRAFLHNNLNLSVLKHDANIKASFWVFRSENLNDIVIKNKVVILLPFKFLNIKEWQYVGMSNKNKGLYEDIVAEYFAMILDLLKEDILEV